MLGQNEALAKVKQVIEEKRKEHADEVVQFGFKEQWAWQGNVGTLMGMGASRSVVVLDDKVEVTIKLPLTAMVMKPH